MAKTDLSAERLRELFDYDQTTGKFTNIVRRSGVRFGATAGAISGNGYIYISVDGEKHCAHRLAFLYVNGKFPDGFVDHADGNRANNSFSNLRLASISQNGFNARLRSDNTTGRKGVVWCGRWNRWRARAHINGKQINLGMYIQFEDAAAAYEGFAKQAHGDFYKEVSAQI